jgi:hypothetical protein
MGIRSTGRQLPMRVRLSRPINYGANFYLEITDETSRMVVMELELDAEALADLMSNREAKAPAGVTTKLDRVGKLMEHDQVVLESSTFKDQADADAAADNWRTREGWDTASVSRNNQRNWVLTGRRWVDPQ